MMTNGKLWHQSYAPGVPPEIEIEQITLSAALTRSAGPRAGLAAMNYLGKTITFGELEVMVNRFARALQELGVGPGDKVALLLPNLPQMTIAVYASFRIGAVAVPNNPLYTERELAHQLNDSDSKVVVGLDLLLPRMLKLKEQTGIEQIVTCHINDYLPFPKKQLYPLVKKEMYRKVTPAPGVHQFTDLISRSSGAPVEELSRWEEVAALIYTGGTTGAGKGVMLTHANICANVQQFAAWLPGVAEGETLLGVYPYFHSAGFTAMQNYALWAGLTVIMVPRPDPAIVAEMVKKFKPDYLPGVPTIFVGLLNSPEFAGMDLSFIKGYFAGSAPLPADTYNRLQELTGAPLLDVYGLTECTPIATVSPWQGKIKPGTVGLPLPNTEIKIVDLETGEREMPPGEAGEILIKGPQVMKGYYKNPEETARTIKEGWLYTADIGLFDDEGYLSVIDRKKDLIIAGGFNVYPTEIDDILFTHPKVLEACTVGIPDQYRGETVKSYVVPQPGAEPTTEELVAYCKENLAAYKVPKQVEFIEELPKSAIGKILRREVKQKAMAQQAEQSNS
jgi:long-chain acyl-CoA synthetase